MNKLRYKIAALVGGSVFFTFFIILVIFNIIMNRQIETNAKNSINTLMSDENWENITLYTPEIIDFDVDFRNRDYSNNSEYNNTEKKIIEWLKYNTIEGIQKVKIGANTYYLYSQMIPESDTDTNEYLSDDEFFYDDWNTVVYVDITGEPELINKMSMIFLITALAIGTFGSIAGYFMGKRLEQNHLVQKQFFENTSHELKTPLTSIRGYAEGIEKGVITDYVKTGRIISAQTEKMSHLIEEILLMAKLESGAMQLHREQVEFNELVENCLMPLEGVILNRNLSVSLSLEKSTISADPDRLEQAISNLLTNAVKYAQSFLDISFDGKVLSVQNDCNEISDDELKHLFERFYTRKKGNTGIGLALSKEIIELHGWKIQAIKTSKGIDFKVFIL